MTELQCPQVKVRRAGLSAEFLHELRTPLNHILGYSEMLSEQAGQDGQTEMVSDLQKIHAAGRQLLSLLSNGAIAQPELALEDRVSVSPEGVSLAQKETGQEWVAAPASANDALILVVDDNPMNRDMLSRRLEHQGYGVAIAEDGREAMSALRERAFDLVLLDIMMPGLDGYEVLRQIKTDEHLRHIPVLMISALDELESVVRCIELGADDYLPKPFEPTLLKARIAACLEKKRARDREANLFTQLQDNFKRLQELEKLRDDLTNMIVHDLRTPLSAVIGGVKTLERAGKLDDTQTKMVAIAVRGGDTLMGMINDLLDVDKMESGAMQLDYAELVAAELVESASSQVRWLLEYKNLKLVTQITPGTPPFEGDENKLRRALVNLLGNSIKFTPSRGTITVAVQRDPNSPSIIFSVSDTGEGIPAEAFDRIFEKFGQVKSRQDGHIMSTGLGLTFCKLAVEAHGGSIEVQSVPGKGSTFSFTVPIVRSTHTPAWNKGSDPSER